MVAGEDDVRQAVRLILETAPGERVMRPECGAGLRRLRLRADQPDDARPRPSPGRRGPRRLGAADRRRRGRRLGGRGRHGQAAHPDRLQDPRDEHVPQPRLPVLPPGGARVSVGAAGAELERRRPGYLPEWRPGASGGAALLAIVAHLADLVDEGLAAAPDAAFLAFLDTLGVSLLPPSPARAPLVFTLAADAPVDVPLREDSEVAAVVPPQAAHVPDGRTRRTGCPARPCRLRHGPRDLARAGPPRLSLQPRPRHGRVERSHRRGSRPGVRALRRSRPGRPPPLPRARHVVRPAGRGGDHAPRRRQHAARPAGADRPCRPRVRVPHCGRLDAVRSGRRPDARANGGRPRAAAEGMRRAARTRARRRCRELLDSRPRRRAVAASGQRGGDGAPPHRHVARAAVRRRGGAAARRGVRGCGSARHLQGLPSLRAAGRPRRELPPRVRRGVQARRSEDHPHRRAVRVERSDDEQRRSHLGVQHRRGQLERVLPADQELFQKKANPADPDRTVRSTRPSGLEQGDREWPRARSGSASACRAAATARRRRLRAPR